MPVKFYSSGMYVRLAFAVAAHLDPDILIVDEVLAVGDAGFQRKSLGKMSEAAQEGRTILFVSHHADSIRRLCSRGIHLSSGRIATIGSASEVLESYRLELEEGLAVGEHAERKSTGEGGALIVRLHTLDRDGRVATAFESDEEIALVLEATIDRDLVGRPLNVGFGVDTEAGYSAFTTFSSWNDTPLVATGESLAVRCRIPAPHLVDGRYFLSASLLCDGATLDHVERSASFEIRARDELLWPNRVLSHGPLHVDCSFEHVDSPAATPGVGA